jgi:Cof subfamily protein (haloacid dehalogenase superfamily)
MSDDIRLIGIDLDRTLLDDRRSVSAENRAALEAACARGVVLAVCSGRDLPATRVITEDLGLPCWFIVQNGSLVLDTGLSLVFTRTFSSLIALRAMDILDRHGLPPVVYDVHPRSEYVWWQTDAEAAPGVLQFRLDHGSKVEFVDDIRSVLDQPVSHFEVFGTREAIMAAEDEFSKDADMVALANVGASRPDSAFMGIYAAGTSKEAGLAHVATELSIDREQVLAIGDNLNDVGIVAWAGRGVMVANGPDEAKGAADWIAPSNNESGVAAALHRYVLVD